MTSAGCTPFAFASSARLLPSAAGVRLRLVDEDLRLARRRQRRAALESVFGASQSAASFFRKLASANAATRCSAVMSASSRHAKQPSKSDVPRRQLNGRMNGCVRSIE